MALAAVPLLAANALDPRLFNGEPMWLKPLKFHLALVVFIGTLPFTLAGGTTRLTNPMRSASAASNLRAETKMSTVLAAPITFMKRRTPTGL